MNWTKRLLSPTCLILGQVLLSSCAVLFKVQLADIESSPGGQPISVLVSENTVDFQQVGAVMEGLGRSSKSKGLQKSGSTVSDIASLFQYGPRTGTPVFNDGYASLLVEQLMEKCKGGHVADIISVREARTYPIISGQIVRVDATCYKR